MPHNVRKHSFIPYNIIWRKKWQMNTQIWTFNYFCQMQFFFFYISGKPWNKRWLVCVCGNRASLTGSGSDLQTCVCRGHGVSDWMRRRRSFRICYRESSLRSESAHTRTHTRWHEQQLLSNGNPLERKKKKKEIWLGLTTLPCCSAIWLMNSPESV